MNVPRPLLIVAVLIVVLGVLACGVGAGRALNDRPAPANSSPRADLDIVPVFPIAGRDVVMSGSCTEQTVAGERRFTGTSCALTVTPSGFFPHELRLRLDAGSGTMTVSQEIRGDVRTSTKAIPGANPLHVRVAGSSPVTALLACFAQCTVAVVSA